MNSPVLRACVLVSCLAAVPVATCVAQVLPDAAPERFEALDANGDGVLSKKDGAMGLEELKAGLGTTMIR